MSNQKKAKGLSIKEIWNHAMQGYLANTPPADRQDPEHDRMFSVYLRAVEKPQTYRYLRAHMKELCGTSYPISQHELRLSLNEETIIRELKGKPLAEVAELANRASNAQRELGAAFIAFQKELGNNGRRASAADGQPQATGKSAEPKHGNDKPAKKPRRTVPSGARDQDRSAV